MAVNIIPTSLKDKFTRVLKNAKKKTLPKTKMAIENPNVQ